MTGTLAVPLCCGPRFPEGVAVQPTTKGEGGRDAFQGMCDTLSKPDVGCRDLAAGTGLAGLLLEHMKDRYLPKQDLIPALQAKGILPENRARPVP